MFSSGGAASLAREYDLPLLGSVPLDPVSDGLLVVDARLQR